MKRFLALFFAAVMTLSLCACGESGSAGTASKSASAAKSEAPAATEAPAASAEKSEAAASHEAVSLTVGTASSSGAFYAIAAGLADACGKHSDFLSLMVQATNGGSENLELVNNGEMGLGFATTSSGSCAYYDNGFNGESGQKNINGVMALQSSMYQMLVRADAGIETYADFKGSGLTVCAGNMVPEHQAISKAIFAANGVDMEKDISVVYLSQDEACEKLADGDVDAAVIMTGVPAALFSNLTVDEKFKLVDCDPAILAELTKEGGELDYEVQTVIPAGTYNNDKDINTVSARTLMFCNPDLEEDVVYEVCKIMYEYWDEIKLSHSALEPVDKDTICNTVIPLHPGAEKFYKEIGILG